MIFLILLAIILLSTTTIKANDLVSRTNISGQWFLAYNNASEVNQFILKRGYFTIKTKIDDTFSVRYTQDITLDQEGNDAGNVEIRLKYLYLKIKLDQFDLFKDSYLLTGFIAIIAVTAIGTIATGTFNLGFASQPVAHTDGLWNFLGMTAVGWGSVLLGGCPLRQLILSGEGNTDSAVTIMGLLVGAAFAHNFGLAASPKGVPTNGMVALVIGLIILLGVSAINSEVYSRSA